MPSLNKLTLIGHVGKDPDVRRTPDGKPVANFMIATTETWRDKASGERKEATEWHRVVVMNDAITAIVEKYVRKGTLLYIEGRLQTRRWEKDGAERFTTEVVLQGFNATLTMLSKAEPADATDSA
jgi:single-strand DNA-binding protein